MDSDTLQTELDEISLIPNCFTFDPEECLMALGDTNKQYTILTQNIRSINKNFLKLLFFLDRLKFLPDVIILTECWLNENSTDLSLDHYTFYKSTTYRNQNDGLVIFAKEELNVAITEPPFEDSNYLNL